MTTTDRPGHRPVIEVLYVQDCPHYPATLALVERLRAELGIDAELRPSLIVDQTAADQARFPGSPTVRVDGHDVEPGSELVTEYTVACRLYRLKDHSRPTSGRRPTLTRTRQRRNHGQGHRIHHHVGRRFRHRTR